jgi:hypothetical protein
MAMASYPDSPKVSSANSLSQYVNSVVALQKKFGVIAINKKETAGSLGRAAIALRSMAAVNQQKPPYW